MRYVSSLANGREAGRLPASVLLSSLHRTPGAARPGARPPEAALQECGKPGRWTARGSLVLGRFAARDEFGDRRAFDVVPKHTATKET
jgi:hypothetical protein